MKPFIRALRDTIVKMLLPIFRRLL